MWIPLQNIGGSVGAIWPVSIGVASVQAEALRSRGLPVPSPVRVLGLIDTGANYSSVDDRVVQALGLESIEKTHVWAAERTPRLAEVFAVDVLVPVPGGKPLVCRDLRVTAMNVSGGGHDVQVIVGSDLLSFVTFVYDGPNRRFAFVVPETPERGAQPDVQPVHRDKER